MIESPVKGAGYNTASSIDYEILRLKRELGSEDAKGHSCEHCNHIKIKPILEPRKGWGTLKEPKFLQLDTNEKEVRRLAESGCNFWVMIRDQLAYLDLKRMVEQQKDKVKFDLKKYHNWWSNEHYKDLAAALGGKEEEEFWHLHRQRGVSWGFSSGVRFDFPVVEEDFVRVTMGYSSLNNFRDKPIEVEIKLIVPERPMNIVSYSWLPNREMGIHSHDHWTSFLALKLPGDNPEDVLRSCVGTPINLTPASSSSMTLTGQWLKKCEAEHGCGINLPPSSMPSMVLDVSGRDEVKLVRVPETLRERYIALSYCWGRGSQTIMLNKANESTLASGISPQQLDPTIRDAVTVTRQLGFKFLWIDALCIFQDDHKFKARELDRMGDVYQNATFTVVASAAKDVRDGFLAKRSSTLERVAAESGRPEFVFKMETEKEEGNSIGTSPVILRHSNLDKAEPWYERAWTLQEMLFSRRRLQYRHNQTTWICYCSEVPSQQCDGWLGGKGNTYNNNSDGELFGNIMAILRDGKSPDPKTTILETWYDLVSVYSGRKLTYHTDRLPAISAIAKEFGSVLGNEYLCGLWKSELPSGLVWYPLNARDASGPRPRPSWSWASYEGTATWWGHRREKWWKNEDFEILGCRVGLALPSDSFGEVETAELRVRGLLRPFSAPERSSIGETSLELEDRRMSSALVFFDYREDPRIQPGAGAKLGLLVVVNADRTGVEGMVLLEENEDQYSRVGSFRLEDVWPWPDDWPDSDDEELEKYSLEEYRARIRSLWGGEENIRDIVLV